MKLKGQYMVLHLYIFFLILNLSDFISFYKFYLHYNLPSVIVY